MTHRRIPRRRAALVATGAAVLMATAFAAPPADPAPGPSPTALTPVAAGKLSASLSASLKAEAAGTYYDPRTKRLVVNVTSRKAAGTARSAGAEPRLVRNSLAELDASRAVLKEKAAIPGTSWSMDPRINKVVITVDSTVDRDGLSTIENVVDGQAKRVVVKRTAGRIEPLLAGGDAIWGGEARCSLGFNVVKGGEPYFLTAGHCGNASPAWSASRGGPFVGFTEDSSFPGDDYALVRYSAGVRHPSAVNLYGGGSREITQAGEPIVGQYVERSGSTTQVHDGVVIGLDETVNYQEGSVEGLIKTTVCAEPGDSGGPLFADDTALGLTSGGSGNCTAGGLTYFQPVTEALQTYDAQIG